MRVKRRGFWYLAVLFMLLMFSTLIGSHLQRNGDINWSDAGGYLLLRWIGIAAVFALVSAYVGALLLPGIMARIYPTVKKVDNQWNPKWLWLIMTVLMF